VNEVWLRYAIRRDCFAVRPIVIAFNDKHGCRCPNKTSYSATLRHLPNRLAQS
jgi:hypothetical protein